jgi:Ca2+-binding EF-hand superfamily protein
MDKNEDGKVDFQEFVDFANNLLANIENLAYN